MGPVRSLAPSSHLDTHLGLAIPQSFGTDQNTERFTIFGRRLLPRNPLPNRLPFQAPEGQLHHPHLPPQYQLQRQHLLGHPTRPVEPCSDHLEGYAPMTTFGNAT